MSKLLTIKSYLRLLVEDYLITSPSFFYKNKYGVDDTSLNTKLTELKLQGYTSIEGLLSSEELKDIGIKIDKAVSGEMHNIDIKWNDQVKYWVIQNALVLDSSLLKSALNTKCLGIIERYFRRMPYLADVDMRRIPPADMESIELGGYSSSNWHRDTRGRQLKMMIYLTDVDENDSNFSFLPRSHISAFRRKLNHKASRFTDDEIADMQSEPVEWYGKAGSVMLFDTNLIHRLRRKPTSKVRDSITFYYTPGQNTRLLKLGESVLPQCISSKAEVLQSPRWPLSMRN